MRLRYQRSLPVLLVLGLVIGCSEDPVTEPDGSAEVLSATATESPYNALSAVVSFAVAEAESARVVYAPRATEEIAATPFLPVADGTGEIPVVGLRPGLLYRFVVEVVGHGSVARSDTVEFRAGSLPAPLDKLGIQVTGNTEGYGFTGVNLDGQGYLVAFDGAGEIRWYRAPEGYRGGHAEPLPNGNFIAYVGTSRGWEPAYGYYVEIRPDGESIRQHHAPVPLYLDPHEFLLTDFEDGEPNVHLFTYSLRRRDLSSLGGPADALVAGHQIVRMQGTEVRYLWNAWDHFEIEDWIEEPRPGPDSSPADFDHPNSLDIDLDGNYIASFRNMAEITKIDSHTGGIIWRLGGANNQFQIVGDLPEMFNGQHSVRVLEDGNLLVYDNGGRHTPPVTRILEYEIDEDAMIATLVGEFRHPQGIYTGFRGSVQRLKNGHTVIGYSSAGRITELDEAGAIVWEALLTHGNREAGFYRALKMESLYGVGGS